MSNTVKQLQELATKGAEWRGHWLGKWRKAETMAGYTVYTSRCVNCGAYVQVCPDPPPNGIDIGGDAVAVNCPVR